MIQSLEWKRVYNYYFKRRNNRVEAYYYKGKFDDISDFFKDKSITYETTDEFIDWLQDKFQAENGKKISNSYYNKYLSLLKVVARLHGTNIDDYKGRNIYEDMVHTEKLTLNEFGRLLKANTPYTRASKYLNFRDSLLIKVAVITTQRPGNIAGLKWEHLVNHYLLFPLTKNGLPHKVYIPQHIEDDLMKLHKWPHGYIFGQAKGPFTDEWFTAMIRARCKVAGITKNITARSMRGTGATEYLKKFALHEVQKITGHRDPAILVNHYYDPENKVIENKIDNNPFDPKPITTDDIYTYANELVMSLLKRKVQAVMIDQTHNIVITIPKLSS